VLIWAPPCARFRAMIFVADPPTNSLPGAPQAGSESNSDVQALRVLWAS